MHPQRIILGAAIIVAAGYAWLSGAFVGAGGPRGDPEPQRPVHVGMQRATFAAGCFWCTEADFDEVPGVIRTTSGYTGGRVANPTYAQVSAGRTGHAEAVEIVFDPAVVTYEELLGHFWRNVDPFVANRQFCDVGTQYRPEIFVHDSAQRTAAEASRADVQARFSQRVVVAVTPADTFYPAEPYHQDYHRTHAVQYRYYRWRCGRDARLEQIWGDEAAHAPADSVDRP